MSHLAFSRMAFRIVATLAATAWLAACGYKGPLYLPKPTPAANAAQRPSATRRPAAPAPTPPVVAPGVTITPGYPSYPPLTVPQ